MCSVFRLAGLSLLLSATLIGCKAAPPSPPDPSPKDWLSSYPKGIPFPILATDGGNAGIKGVFHGSPHQLDQLLPTSVRLYGILRKVDEDQSDIGLSILGSVFHHYTENDNTLEVYLSPKHLEDPNGVHLAAIPTTSFTVPSDISTVRVLFLP